MKMPPAIRPNRCAALALLIVMLAALLAPGAPAEPAAKVVRVGWYESSFNMTDRNGRRSGYAYEYQQKIASYSGWRYEYVSGSWPVLLEMLMDGEIDLLSDISYTPERAESLLYADLPMGTEEYYLFVSPDNQEISNVDYATLNGKRVGVNRGSVQVGFYRDWAERNAVQSELIEVITTEDESLRMLESGELDAYVTVDSFTDPDRAAPVCKVGSSDFFFAVNRDRPDLLEDLNRAMNRIREENRYYNQQMFEKYFRRTGANAFLAPDELDWLAAHGPIRVGYQDNYLAFCARDGDTGELTGALKDYLAYAADCMANAHIEFEATAYPTSADAIDALNRGEVDCVFPANLNSYDGESLGVMLTPTLLSTDVYALVRMSEQQMFAKREHVIVAVNEGNPNYDTFLLDHFPDWTRVYYPSTEECLEAVSKRVADCVLISITRFNNIARLCEKYRLVPLTTGEELDYAFAVGAGATPLYSILSKATGRIPQYALNAAMSIYITEDARRTFTDFIMDNLPVVMIVTAALVLVILTLMMRSMRAERKAQNLIRATETDHLTGLYNRDFFFQYANRMFREHPDVPMDAIVINIEQFHSVNALNGREFGNRVLYILGNGIKEIANESAGIAGRFEADRFDIYCPHTDEYRAIYTRLQAGLDDLSPNVSIRLRMGVMPWQAGLEPVQLFDRARTACSMARGHYEKHLIVFDENVGKREIYDQRLQNDLRRALDTFAFEVYYQPQFDIQADPPKLVSAEALVRWNHPELGLISPEDFVPLFERKGRIGEVDKFVWAEAARQVARWRERYGFTLPVSVNLSRVDVFDPPLASTLDDILAYNGLRHDDLRLEVTESAYTENAEQVINVVADLRQRGYKVEMDDFGTGYSSLNMLSAMPIDVLKMDRAFIRNIDHDEKDVQLVALILGIARSLKIPVVAEGVETERQVRLLRDLGCELVQGYYFSRPLHPADFEAAYLTHPQPTLDPTER